MKTKLELIYLYTPSACAWCGKEFSLCQLIFVDNESLLPFCNRECFGIWTFGEKTGGSYTKKYFKRFPIGKELERSIYEDIPTSCASYECKRKFSPMDAAFVERITLLPFCSLHCAIVWGHDKNLSMKLRGKGKIFLREMIFASISQN